MAARKLRYDWFSELLEEYNYDYLLTAHHLDDSLETFLINLTRGSGLDGLTGIPSQNEQIIRPLLVFSRQDIEQYAKEKLNPCKLCPCHHSKYCLLTANLDDCGHQEKKERQTRLQKLIHCHG